MPTDSLPSETDFIVVGAGIAGLRASVELAPVGRVLCLAKKEVTESNTHYAQGGIAAALSDDDEVSIHLDDTLKAGDGLCNAEAARILVEEGPQRIEELIYDLKKEYTIVIVTHNMQQAARVSDTTAFFWLGTLVEYGKTTEMFTKPAQKLTEDYITGRFG